MRKTDTLVPSHVIDVLQNATVLPDRLILNGQLDRKTYKDTADTLDRIGGKWNTKAKAHLFQAEYDVRGLVAEMLDTKRMPRKENENPYSFFPTTARVAIRLLDFTRKNIPDLSKITFREPSAGDGAIIKVLLHQGALPGKIHAIELDESRAAKVRELGVECEAADFLAMSDLPLVDLIAMNPPFSGPGNSSLYVDHIEHALQGLKVGGSLATVAPSSLKWKTDKKTARLRELVEANGFIEDLPEDSFKESGTLVSTVIAVICK